MGISNVSNGLRSGVCTSSTRPTAPYEGQMIYETDTNRVLVYDNTAWVMIADTDTPPGLQLVKTQTIGSGVSSIVVSDAFNAEFDNYVVTIAGGSGTTNTLFNMTIGSASSGYRWQYLYGSYGSTAQAVGDIAGTNFPYVGSITGGNIMAKVEIMSPFLSKPTRVFYDGASIGNFTGSTTGTQIDSTSFSAFTLVTGAGTVTGGVIRIYGYRN